MTRKDFLLGACAAASAMATSSPIKSILGGRSNANAIEELVPSASGYIQEGLVAMYDAIENAGLGVHDSNATQVANLCGGSPIYLQPGVKIGHNAISYTTSFSADAITDWDYGGITDEMNELPLAGEPCTTEAVWQSSSGTSWSDYRFAFAYRNSLAGCNNKRQVHAYGTMRQSSTNIWRYWGWNATNNMQMSSTSNIIRAWNDHNAYINLVLPEHDSSISISIFPQDARIRVLTSSVAIASMKFACLRIYNRSLTEEEIAYNYEIDKARFGL